MINSYKKNTGNQIFFHLILENIILNKKKNFTGIQNKKEKLCILDGGMRIKHLFVMITYFIMRVGEELEKVT